MRCSEWVRKLAGMSDDNLESAKVRNEYVQFLRIQVRNNFLHGPFASPPPENDGLCPLAELLANMLTKQVGRSQLLYFHRRRSLILTSIVIKKRYRRSLILKTCLNPRVRSRACREPDRYVPCCTDSRQMGERSFRSSRYLKVACCVTWP